MRGPLLFLVPLAVAAAGLTGCQAVGERLFAPLTTRLDTVNAQLGETNRQLTEVNRQLGGVNDRLDKTNGYLAGVQDRLDTTNARLGSVDTRLAGVNDGLGGVNRPPDDEREAGRPGGG